MIQGKFCNKGWWIVQNGKVVVSGPEINPRSFNKPARECQDAYTALVYAAPAEEGGIFPASAEDMPEVQEVM